MGIRNWERVDYGGVSRLGERKIRLGGKYGWKVES